jgi:hypothetical protein
MAARNRVVSAGGGGASNGTTQGVNDQTVMVFQGLQQLVGDYVNNSELLFSPDIPTLWTKVDYV